MKINNKKNSGFSLIELMISLSIMSILMALAAPNYTAFLANMRIKNTAENINLGIIQARAEAVRRNELIFFILNPDTSWEIKTQDDNVINRKEARESSKGVVLNITPANSSFVTFNGMGSISANGDSSQSIDTIVVSNNEGISGITPLNIKIWHGGGSLVCSRDCATRNVN